MFSGGRDSTFALLWARQNFPDLRTIAVFSDTGVEFPGMTVHVKRVCDHLGAELKIVKPEHDMLIDIVENGFPATVYLSCREKYIYRPINQFFRTFPPEEVVIIDGLPGRPGSQAVEEVEDKRPGRYGKIHLLPPRPRRRRRDAAGDPRQERRPALGGV